MNATSRESEALRAFALEPDNAHQYRQVAATLYVGDQIARIADVMEEETTKGGALDARQVADAVRPLGRCVTNGIFSAEVVQT